MSIVEVPCSLAVIRLREIIRSFHAVCKDFSRVLLSICARFSTRPV